MNYGALILMFFVGIMGVMVASYPTDDKPNWHLWAGLAWAILWCGPFLVSLWIAGVFG
jgi:hypothetical protein